MNAPDINIVYRSAARSCIESCGMYVHVERKGSLWAEARLAGQGGPRSGIVLGRMEGGEWTVDPRDAAVRDLMLSAISLE
jgi:hypothetical protein